MPKNSRLFQSWTWSRSLPSPFEHDDISKSSTESTSCHNLATPKKATLHAATLKGILAYMAIDASLGTPDAQGGIGTQGDSIWVAEYPSGSGETHVVNFNENTGKFSAGRFTDSDSVPELYTLKETDQSGAALFFALMPKFLLDEEFSKYYGKLAQERDKGYANVDAVAEAGYILCDNAYRRIENATKLGEAGIPVSIDSGNIQRFTPMNLKKGLYNPSNTIHGEFKILQVGAIPSPTASVTKHEEFAGNYSISKDRVFTSQEENLIPKLPSWYIIPEEVKTICQYARETTTSHQPMRNFMMRGPGGTGKTEGARAIAAGLGLPYVFLTCSSDFDKFDFIGQFVPKTGQNRTKQGAVGELPTFDDIRMDPPTAYAKMTGIYEETITEDMVYQQLMETIAQRTAQQLEQPQEQQGFQYTDTPFIQAIRNGWVIEVQEPSVIANQGVLVGLNALLDNCESIMLPTGEVIHRHPDTVVVITTNTDYVGCRPMNQSVLSRMDLIVDVDEPTEDILIRRVSGITGCKDTAILKQMSEAIREIQAKCRAEAIQDGICGTRELIAWVQSFMICHNALDAATYTVLSSVSSDPDNREEIKRTCLETRFSM